MRMELFGVLLAASVLVLPAGPRIFAVDRKAGNAEPGEGFLEVGKLRPRTAKEISGSNWSVGAETMDRDFTVYRHWKQYLGPLGAKKARLQSGWAKTEKVAGKYDWAWLDEIVDDMAAQGVEPWMCICYGNLIYKGGGTEGLGGGMVESEEALAAWDRYVAALVARYKDKIGEWEIWNEPALGRADDPANSAAYAALFIRTAEIVRREQPKAKILGLSMPGIKIDWCKRVLDILREKAKLGLLDEVTYHPYSMNPDASYPIVEELRALVAAYGAHLSIRQGENGAPSTKGTFGALADDRWTEQRQAKWALRRLLGDLGRDIPSSYFSICDMQYPKLVNYKGLLAIKEDKTVDHVKQAYYAVQHVTAVFDDSLQRVAEFRGEVAGGPEKAEYSVFGYSGEKGAVVTVWRRDGVPWADETLARVTLTLSGVDFKEPVWVDMLRGRVYAMKRETWNSSAKGAAFTQVPVGDYPVLLAEKAVLPLQR